MTCVDGTVVFFCVTFKQNWLSVGKQCCTALLVTKENKTLYQNQKIDFI